MVVAAHAETAMAAPDGFVFSDDGGTAAWKPNRVTKAFLRHRRTDGLRPFRLHDLRHFIATEMLDAGVPIVVVPVGSITNASRPHSTNTLKQATEQARVHRQVPAHHVNRYEHKAWSMISIGGDSHERTRTVVAVDQVGRKAVHPYVKR